VHRWRGATKCAGVSYNRVLTVLAESRRGVGGGKWCRACGRQAVDRRGEFCRGPTVGGLGVGGGQVVVGWLLRDRASVVSSRL